MSSLISEISNFTFEYIDKKFQEQQHVPTMYFLPILASVKIFIYMSIDYRIQFRPPVVVGFAFCTQENELKYSKETKTDYMMAQSFWENLTTSIYKYIHKW